MYVYKVYIYTHRPIHAFEVPSITPQKQYLFIHVMYAWVCTWLCICMRVYRQTLTRLCCYRKTLQNTNPERDLMAGWEARKAARISH